MSYIEEEVDIFEIYDKVASSSPALPNTYPLAFELESNRDLFEFLLQFVTMLCKNKYGDNNGRVNLAHMTPEEFNTVNRYMQSIGYNCTFKAVPANSHNINNTYENRYDRIKITSQTKMSDLLFGIKCDDILYIISFDYIGI